MFEATLADASLLKKVLDAIKDLVTEANFDCNTEGISLQAMDTARVALVSFFLQADGFEEYRCDRSISLGINLNSLTKIMKCANSDDKGLFHYLLTTTSAFSPLYCFFLFDYMNNVFFFFLSLFSLFFFFVFVISSFSFVFSQLPSRLMTVHPLLPLPSLVPVCHIINRKSSLCVTVFLSPFFFRTASERVSQFTLKLMEINQQRLGIPQTDYKATVQMSSAEFQRISRDLSVIGDSVTLGVKKDSIMFSVTGDIGEGNICLRQGGSADRGDETIVDCSEPVTANFALKYFNNFTKATALANSVTLQLFPGLPLNVQYKMEEKGFIRFYLAPKVDEDEEDSTDM